MILGREIVPCWINGLVVRDDKKIYPYGVFYFKSSDKKNYR